MTTEGKRPGSDAHFDLEKLRTRCFNGLSRALDRGMRSAVFMSWMQGCLTAMNKAKSMQNLSFDMLYQLASTRRQWQSAAEATNHGDPR